MQEPEKQRGGGQERRQRQRTARPAPPGSPCPARAAPGSLMRPLPRRKRKHRGSSLGLLALCLAAARCLQSKHGAGRGAGPTRRGAQGGPGRRAPGRRPSPTPAGGPGWQGTRSFSGSGAPAAAGGTPGPPQGARLAPAGRALSEPEAAREITGSRSPPLQCFSFLFPGIIRLQPRFLSPQERTGPAPYRGDPSPS